MANEAINSKSGVSRGRPDSRTLANTIVFTAFVAAVTMAFSVYVPATKGYFNIGEVMVYTSALLMGPYVGAFAGGVGSAISDAILAPQYAPGTLAIKGLEGFIVGRMTTSRFVNLSRSMWKITGGILGASVGFFVGWLGVDYLSGPRQFYLGFSNNSSTTIGPWTIPPWTIGPQLNTSFVVPSWLWIVVGLTTFVAVTLVCLSIDEKLGWTAFSILVGGSAMVLGYFLYESIALQLGFVTGSIEVPVNVIQVLVGLIVSIPVVRSIRKVSAGRVMIKSDNAALASPEAS